ncbi:MAG: aminoglycoside 6-adenylyltransferase [Candidatus Kerfeldbacteria bacterium]
MAKIHTELMRNIEAALDSDDRVLACWYEGSIARAEDDDYSDIDLWITVKDKDFESFIDDREKFAAQLGDVLSVLYPRVMDQDADIDSFSVVFEDQPITLTLDVDVQKRSRKFTFTKDSDAQECRMIFDKANVIRYKPFNPQQVEQYVEEVYDDLVMRFWHQLPRLKAMIEREDILEATDQYMKRLEDLVTLYRIMYTPEKVDWGFKDIEYDLPGDAVKVIYNLLPHEAPRALHRQMQKLAGVFSKQTKLTAKRLRVNMPKLLSEHISKGL